MKRTCALPALVVLLAAGPAAAATPRAEVARRFAPVFLQEVRDGRDLYSAFDFDGNWAGEDNSENLACALDADRCVSSPCAGGACPLVGTVYFTVIESQTHWFIHYLPYHPVDAKL